MIKPRFYWFRWVGLFEREFTIYLSLLGITPWIACSKAWAAGKPAVSAGRYGLNFYSGRVNFGIWWAF